MWEVQGAVAVTVRFPVCGIDSGIFFSVGPVNEVFKKMASKFLEHNSHLKVQIHGKVQLPEQLSIFGLHRLAISFLLNSRNVHKRRPVPILANIPEPGWKLISKSLQMGR